MLLIETTQRILGYENEEIISGTENGVDKPLTFREAVGTALNNFTPGEVPPPEQKMTAALLTVRLFDGPTVDLTIEDAAFIKERVGLVSMPIVYLRVSQIIENAGQIVTEPAAEPTE